MTKLHEYETKVCTSEDIKTLQKLINDTNKKMQIKFKREHQYEILKHEEQLYKEVMYDMRPTVTQDEELAMNPLKKAKYAGKIRNSREIYDAALKEARWPIHMKKP